MNRAERRRTQGSAILIGDRSAPTTKFGLDTMSSKQKRARDFIMSKAMEAIFQEIPVEMWSKLSGDDKAIVCTKVIRALLDPKLVASILNGEKKRLI